MEYIYYYAHAHAHAHDVRSVVCTVAMADARTHPGGYMQYLDRYSVHSAQCDQIDQVALHINTYTSRVCQTDSDC